MRLSSAGGSRRPRAATGRRRTGSINRLASGLRQCPLALSGPMNLPRRQLRKRILRHTLPTRPTATLAATLASGRQVVVGSSRSVEQHPLGRRGNSSATGRFTVRTAPPKPITMISRWGTAAANHAAEPLSARRRSQTAYGPRLRGRPGPRAPGGPATPSP